MISSMLWTIDTVSRQRLSVPAVIVDKEKSNPQKTQLIEAPKYPLSGRSSCSATCVSVRKVLDHRATAAEGHQTRKSISTSSLRFPKENVCETYKEILSQASPSTSPDYQENEFYSKSSKSSSDVITKTFDERTLYDSEKMLKTKGEKVEAGGDSLISVMGKRNDGSCMREEINDSPQKKSTSLGYAFRLPASKASEHMNETQFSRIVNPKWKTVDGVRETEKKKSVDSKKSDGNLSDILSNHTLELHLQSRSRARSTELIPRSIVPRENKFIIGEKTLLTEPKMKKKLFRAPRDKKVNIK